MNISIQEDIKEKMKKHQKNSSYKALRQTKRTWVMIMLGLFLMVFLVGTGAAAEWDNVKSYDPATNTVTLKNSFLYVIPLSTIAKATLDTPQVYQVGLGYQKVAQFTISPEQDYNNLLGSFEFYDINAGNRKINRQIDIKYLTYEDYEVDNYSCESVLLKNGTAQENCFVSGKHTEQREVWLDWDKNIVSKQNITIGLFTNIQKEERIEWIPTLAGVKISEWAVWDSSLDTGLTHWYKLGLNFSDSTKELNGTNSGTTNITGKYNLTGDGLAKYFDGTTSVNFSDSNFKNNGVAYSFWFMTNSTGCSGDGCAIYAQWNGSGSLADYITIIGDEIHYVFGAVSGSNNRYDTTTANINISEWAHIVINGTGDGATGQYQIYVNGINQSVTFLSAGGNRSRPSGNSTSRLAEIFHPALAQLQGRIDEFAIWNRTLTATEVGILYNDGDGCTYGICDAASTLAVNLDSPANYSNLTTSTVSLVSNVTSSNTGLGITNVSLLINGTINQTNSSGDSGIYNFSLTTGDNYYEWSVLAFGNDSTQYNASNGTLVFTIDTTPPNVSNSNITNLFTTSLPINLTWNYSASDPHLDSCYYNWTGNATYTTVTCNSPIITSISTEGNHTFQYCANDTFGFESCGTNYSYVTLGNISQADNPDPVGEGNIVTFNLSINVSSIPTTTATLILNNTVFYPDTIVAGTNGYFFEKEVTIPLGWGNATGYNQSWLWNYTLSGITTNASTSSANLTVFSLSIDDCSTYGTVIFNMTLRDETNGSLINASAGSNIEVDLQLTGQGNTSVTKQFNHTYTDTNYAPVCVPTGLINNSNYTIDIVGEYSATSFVTEFFYLDDGTLNSSSFLDPFTNKTISTYDLNSSDSTSFLFSFLDEDDVAVPNVIVHVFRQYIGEGIFREVERGKQDNNGQTHLHLVEEDVIYFFKISLDGDLIFTSTTYNAKCLSSPCQIELTASQGAAQFDTNFTGVDGSFEITTFSAQRTVMLQFALNEVSTMNLTLVKQDYTGNFTQVNTTSVTSTGSSLNLTIPQTAGNVTFYAIVYKDGEFVSYKALNLQQRGSDYFGTTGLIMAALMVLALVLMAVFEGAGVIVFLILALVIAGAMGVLDLGYYSLVGLICALIILIFKLVQKRR